MHVLRKLPNRRGGGQWQANLKLLHKLLWGDFQKATNVLNEDDADSVRLKFHYSRIINRCFPNLNAIGIELEGDYYNEWFNNACEELHRLYIALKRKADTSNSK